MAAPPHAVLIPSKWCTVEPLIHAPDSVHATSVSGVCVVDSAVLEDKCAQARALAKECGQVNTGALSETRTGTRSLGCRRLPHGCLTTVVVFDAAAALLVLSEIHAEVKIEVAPKRGCPGERPAHTLLVSLQLRERGA